MTINQADMQLLANFLDEPERPDSTLRLHELQGFLFAIASSPETIAPSEWLPMIGDDEGLNFADQNEAQEILGLVMALYNEVNTAVLERSNALPAGCAFCASLLRTYWTVDFRSGSGARQGWQ